jgi:hypothetical protein
MNKYTAKTRKSLLIIGFIAIFILLSVLSVLILAMLFVIPENSKPAPFIVASVVSLALSGWLAWFASFKRGNITIEVDKDGVRFLRGEKEIRNLSFDEYDISSYIYIYNGAKTKYIRAVKKQTQKKKDCVCSIKNNVYEEMFAFINAMQYKKSNDIPEENQGVPQDNREVFERYENIGADTQSRDELHAKIFGQDGAPIEYSISKIMLKKKLTRHTWLEFGIAAGIAAFAGMYTWLMYGDNTLDLLTIIVWIAGAIIVTAMGIRMYFVSKKIVIPEKIRILSDRIEVDERKFYFNRLSLIKATPESYINDATSMKQRIRRLTFVEAGETYIYTVGTAAGEDAALFYAKSVDFVGFGGYGDLCDKLVALFADEPGKFAFELM